jgi:serine/threonine protein kinase
MDDHALERRVGTVLRGKWTLERLLGSGGMAAVYVAVHKIGRREAIKILHPEIARVPELRARFDQEARAVNQFVHPGAVEIRDIDTTEDGCPFLVMELLEGESLAARARRVGRMDMSEILRIIDELLDVLAAAHAHGIIHRDIKPDNLFCLRDGRLKVLDFGVARVRQAAGSVHTRTGTTLGTISYMPPEQIAGTDVDARADVFAVGATMFRLIARRRVHEAQSDSELLIKMATLPAPPLASVAPETPQAVCAIVDRALAFERDKRYPSATAMLEDIRAVRASQPPAFPQQVVIAVASSHPDEALGTAQTVAAPHAGAASAGQAHAPSSAAPARPSGDADPRPALAPSSTTSAFTQGTQWTVTTARGRRLRWAALAFPLLGAGVLALVYYRAVRVDSDAAPSASSRTLKPPASPPPRSPAVAAGARSAAAASDPSPHKMGGERPRPPSQPAPGSGQGAGALPRTNCMATNTCDFVCDDACQLSCTDQGGCQIGARRDALVNCTGSLTCDVSCEGDCVINCSEGTPCLVRCTPGSKCGIGLCMGEIETCASGSFVCGARCPD